MTQKKVRFSDSKVELLLAAVALATSQIAVSAEETLPALKTNLDINKMC